ncbi:hypothetical protein [Roseovarius sp. 2305UL8-3]|uniref:hypothetical protein n=1 Tax=Roseovarius conchicola TaxID=3121636 RepID=UPI003528E378
MTAILCALFFLGYLLLRSNGQALAFLAIGAGYQALTYVLPAPDGTEVQFDTFLLVCLFSVAGYIAWRMSRKYLEGGLFARHRIGIFAGVATNTGIAVFILWQTGTLTFSS